jgi:hypothetical protein
VLVRSGLFDLDVFISSSSADAACIEMGGEGGFWSSSYFLGKCSPSWVYLPLEEEYILVSLGEKQGPFTAKTYTEELINPALRP